MFSSNHYTAGIKRAKIIYDWGDGTADVYIPDLHRGHNPFKCTINSDGTVSIQNTLTEEYENVYNSPENEDQLNNPSNKTNGKPALYRFPRANLCAWNVRKSFNQGDTVFVMFEGGNSNYPVIMGELGGLLQAGELRVTEGATTTSSYNPPNVNSDAYPSGIDPTTLSGNTVAIRAAEIARSICSNPDSGYSQVNRWGPDYDCSSLVITAYAAAGAPVSTGSGNSETIRGWGVEQGFEDVTSTVTLSTGAGAQVGDILYRSGHVAMVVGTNGQIAAASSANGHPETGDQGPGNGKKHDEIYESSSWYNDSWTKVIRYKG